LLPGRARRDALIHLAVETERLIGAREIAERHDVSLCYLAKVAQWLAAEGYVTLARGRGD